MLPILRAKPTAIRVSGRAVLLRERLGSSPPYTWAPFRASGPASARPSRKSIQAASLSSGPVYQAAQSIGESENDVATDEPIMATVAGRYASALFDLAKDERQLDAVDSDMTSLAQMIETSSDLTRMVRSPVFTADEQGKAIGAIAAGASFNALTANFLQLLARSRRLFALNDIIRDFRKIVARHRGEITADVASAHALTEAQQAALEDSLRSTAGGRNVKIATRVDPSLLGGLIVTMGSRMIDSSLRTKLNALKTRMKEVR